MDSHDTTFICPQNVWSGHVLLVFVTIGLLFLKRKAVNKCNFPPFQAQDFKAKQPHSALHFSDNISQNIPTWLFFFFLEKTVSALSYSVGIFHGYLTSYLGGVVLGLFASPLTLPSDLRAHWRWRGCFCLPAYLITISPPAQLETLWLK